MSEEDMEKEFERRQKVVRDSKGRFLTGGNPKGRPKGSKNKIVAMKQDLELALRENINGNDVTMLVIGLAISIVLMGLLGGLLARLLDRFKIIAYIGVALIAWIGVELMYEGMQNANQVLNLGLPIPAPHHEGAPPH